MKVNELILQYVKGAESFSQLKQLYGKALRAFGAGRNYGFRKIDFESSVCAADKVAMHLDTGDFYRNDNSRDGIAAGVEGITEEEAASVLAACAIWKDHDDLLSIIIYSIISTIILTS
ncbi:hypothetical protein GLOIN_2v1839571 [Rhizophagus irregularis DAOM 181602=DAOM 197198]|nr:hypothetical protein GLOIN_2v1839571 [Rhizophagus irregularis DAOM 181602=DAOM 197198]